MFRTKKTVVAMLAVAPILALVVGGTPQKADAAMLTAFSYDPTSNAVYYQFSTDEPIDAYRVIVREIGTTTRFVRGAHPHGAPVTGFSGVVPGLSCGTHYRFILKIRWVHGGSWVPVQNFDFWTNGC